MTLTYNLYWSFRSPYSYLITHKLVALERDYDVRGNIRPVYPLAVRTPEFFDGRDPLWYSYLQLDIRREAEFQAGHIEDADWHPLDRFKAALPDIPNDAPVAVHCKGGYRSLIACSLLQRAGYHNVVDVVGGLDAWEAASIPTVSRTNVVEVGAK